MVMEDVAALYGDVAALDDDGGCSLAGCSCSLW